MAPILFDELEKFLKVKIGRFGIKEDWHRRGTLTFNLVTAGYTGHIKDLETFLGPRIKSFTGM